MATFSNEEYSDMLLVYGKADCVARAAQRMYQERYPNRRVPGRNTYQNTYRRLRETGRLDNVTRGIVVRHNVEVDERILALFEEDPTRSVRDVASLLEISTWKVWNVLRQNNKYAFHYTPVQGLENNDFDNRVRFCRFLLHTDVDDPDFLKSILWTDESKFTKEGILNLHNLHHWSSKDQNPKVKQQRSFQRRFSVNVWAGVIGNNVIGPHYLPDNLNGDNYLFFLQNELPELMAELPIFNENRRIVFQHDGCPAHWRVTVREHLDNVFPNSWIGRDGPIAWPPRLPDLTPLDFYIWGRAKAIVYATEVETREELIQRIEDAFVTIRQEMNLHTTTVEVRDRCRACIRNRGQQFEQDL
ncbi:unnamed protein product [Pieris macdunnoughi]|uniref:DUF4817 domain-containing protein n=1 Tax=Pieris macdunnoughi TaxID=345717 RepID=A0A821UW06_9NEOP|nr:unnamed protein product [Pieris macdunnoughi]